MAVTWGVFPVILFTCVISLPSSFSLVGTGNVGCLFSESVCDPELEICVDDGVFGSCKQIYELDSDTPPFRFELGREELEKLTQEVEALLAEGYRWSHPRTQCLLQTLLSSFLNGREFDKVFCDTLRDRGPRIFDEPTDEEPEDFKNMAYIRYKPSEMNPNAEFADEIYSPPGLPENTIEPREDENVQVENLEKRSEIPVLFSMVYNTPERFRIGLESRDKSDVEAAQLNNEPKIKQDRRSEEPFFQMMSEDAAHNYRRSEKPLSELLREGNPDNEFISGPVNTFRRSEKPLSELLREENPDNEFISGPVNTFRRSEKPLSELLREGNPDNEFISGPVNTFRRSEKPLSELLNNENPYNELLSGPLSPQMRRSEEPVAQLRSDEPLPLFEAVEEPLSHFRKHYNSPKSFRDASRHLNGEEDGDVGVMRRSPPSSEDSLDFDTDLGVPDTEFNPERVEDTDVILPLTSDADALSEGGPLVLGPSRDSDLALSDLLDELDEWSFQRRERLDVKKPGPQFSTNNYAFQDTSTKKVQDSKHIVTKPSSKPAAVEGQKETMPSELPNHPPKAKVQSRTLWFQSILGDPHKKGEKFSHYPHSHSSSNNHSPSKNSVLDNDQYEVVDTTFAYIKFKDSIKTWQKGVHIIKTVERLLNIPSDTFRSERVDENEVTFKVGPNPMGWSANDVARRIDGIKDQLKKEIGVTVTSAGVGDKNKLPSMVKLNEREEQAYVVIVMVCGVLAALGLSAGVLYLTRRHGNKLANMTSSDTEPSKHYQDLCRARMSSKNGDSGSAVPPHRVASLSRESDNSPSSRSSTSSWSEEPVLSNMDIATGQMVLSYMEDHLKNKDRLESEWAALCAYKADPCATTIAEKEENKVKNRSEMALPYDHARVVLNELSNITGSDYINASTITDHDPRNPAYIVTQGPLPTTAPDFWQMVWEQGCVVIVMLTRLVENDNPMCHRYWPAEGSELYHIFEVHLVSEHIWCDDYLVRSFYLKNMKTGETRTVTQFHFLSWPELSVPQLTKPLLEFRRKVNKSFRGRSCPIVVHCSDGVGRSGTYCLLDMVLNRMAKGAKEIDVAATLEHIRDQRAGALATSQQFRFVISAVSDELHAILRVHPQANQ